MRGRAQFAVLIVAIAAAMSACSSNDKDTVDANKFPAGYKREIIATLQPLFIETETVRISGAFVSEPALTQVDNTQRYTACVRYVGHGLNPGESGNAIRVGFFYGGHLNQLIPATEGQCDKAAYKPFAELNAFCIGRGCYEKLRGAR